MAKANFMSGLACVLSSKHRIIDASAGIAGRERHLAPDLELATFQRPTVFANTLILAGADRNLFDAKRAHALQFIIIAGGIRHAIPPQARSECGLGGRDTGDLGARPVSARGAATAASARKGSGEEAPRWSARAQYITGTAIRATEAVRRSRVRTLSCAPMPGQTRSLERSASHQRSAADVQTPESNSVTPPDWPSEVTSTRRVRVLEGGTKALRGTRP